MSRHGDHSIHIRVVQGRAIQGKAKQGRGRQDGRVEGVTLSAVMCKIDES